MAFNASLSILHISPKGLHLAKFRKQGQSLQLISCASTELSAPIPQEGLSKELKDLFKRARIKGHNLYVAVDLPSTIIKEIEMPPMQEKLIGKALNYELEQHIPYSNKDVIFGHQIQKSTHLQSENADKRKVLLAVIPLNHFEYLNKQLAQSQIKNAQLSLGVDSLCHYYTSLDPNLKKVSVLLLDFSDNKSLNILVVDHGLLRFQKRTACPIPQTVPNAEYTDPAWPDLLEELENALTYVQTIQSIQRPLSVVFHQASYFLDECKEHICDKLRMSISGVRHLVEPEYATCYGLAVQSFSGQKLIELAPSDQKKKEKWPLLEPGLWLVLSCILLLAAIYLPEAIIAQRIRKVKHQLNENQSSVRSIKKKQKQISKIRRELQTLSSNQGPSVPYLTIIKDLHKHLPQEAIVQKIEAFNHGALTIEISGSSQDKLLSSLSQSSYLKELRFETMPNKQIKIKAFASSNEASEYGQ